MGDVEAFEDERSGPLAACSGVHLPYVIGTAVASATVAFPSQDLALVVVVGDWEILAEIELDSGWVPCLAPAFAEPCSSSGAGGFATVAPCSWPASTGFHEYPAASVCRLGRTTPGRT